MSLEDVEMVALMEFGELQQILEQGEWIISTPIWDDPPMARDDGKWKPEGGWI